jgi:hypothetical protein
MNHYFYEKMMETEQKKLNKVSQEFWRTAPAKKRKTNPLINLFTSFKENKRSGPKKQVCCS